MKTTAPTFHLHFCLALVLGFPTAIAGAPVPPNPTRSFHTVLQPGPFTITPSSGRAGQVYDVMIQSAKATCEADKELEKAVIISPQGSPFAVVDTTNQAPCLVTARIRVPSDAPFGKFPLWVLKQKDGDSIGSVDFTITDFIAPGRIPPGMSPSPSVDVMWSVMPKGIVSDNFGSAIAREYYALEIIIGNNSAYNLQLVGVAFELPSDEKLEGLLARNEVNRTLTGTADKQALRKALLAAKSDVRSKLLANPADPEGRGITLLPTSSYKITRGSLEARQLLHKRTLILSTITALGPILTGVTPFFHDINPRGNFTEAINVLSNPIEKGLQLVWPDARPRQRERFDDQVLRDGLIIRNNTQIRTLAFFPKELLRLPKHVESNPQYNAWKDNAREVRERLGKIVIVGDQIQYVNRISLTSDTPPAVTAPPTISGLSQRTFVPGAPAVRITISGSNFQGAQLSVSGTTGVKLDKVDVDPNGHVITADVTVDESTPEGTYRINVSTPSSMGVASEEFEVTAPEATSEPTIESFAKDGTPITSAKPGDTIEIIGENFGGATEVKIGSANVTPDEAANVTDTKIKVKIPTNMAPAEGADVTVKTPGGTSPVKKLQITAPS